MLLIQFVILLDISAVFDTVVDDNQPVYYSNAHSKQVFVRRDFPYCTVVECYLLLNTLTPANTSSVQTPFSTVFYIALVNLLI